MAIEVLRPIMLEGKRVEIGTVLELERKLERELCYYGKARPVAAQPAPTEPEPAKRGKKDSP
jgi:hypothetical protein